MDELRRYKLTWDTFFIQNGFQDKQITGNEGTSKEAYSSSQVVECSTSRKKDISSSHIQKSQTTKGIFKKGKKKGFFLGTKWIGMQFHFPLLWCTSKFSRHIQ
jgi:hypothetical protein